MMALNLLLLATLWKTLVLQSPSFIQCCLAHCLRKISIQFCTRKSSFFTSSLWILSAWVMVRCCSLSSKCFNFSTKVVILLSICPKTSLLHSFNFNFKKLNFFPKMKLRSSTKKLTLPSFHKIGETVHLEPHIFEFEQPSSKGTSPMERIWNMIKSNLRKDYLINPLKMIFSFLGEKEPVNSRQAWNLLMARPSKMCSFQRWIH